MHKVGHEQVAGLHLAVAIANSQGMDGVSPGRSDRVLPGRSGGVLPGIIPFNVLSETETMQDGSGYSLALLGIFYKGESLFVLRGIKGRALDISLCKLKGYIIKYCFDLRARREEVLALFCFYRIQLAKECFLCFSFIRKQRIEFYRAEESISLQQSSEYSSKELPICLLSIESLSEVRFLLGVFSGVFGY